MSSEQLQALLACDLGTSDPTAESTHRIQARCLSFWVLQSALVFRGEHLARPPRFSLRASLEGQPQCQGRYTPDNTSKIT